MVDIDRTFYDKYCDIYRKTVVDKDGTEVPETELIYDKVICDYYIAPRGNVVNFIPEVESRNTQEDRYDCVIPGDKYNIAQPILKGDMVELFRDGQSEGTYVIDQCTIYRMPDGRIENAYLRLNNANKGKQPGTQRE